MLISGSQVRERTRNVKLSIAVAIDRLPKRVAVVVIDDQPDVGFAGDYLNLGRRGEFDGRLLFKKRNLEGGNCSALQGCNIFLQSARVAGGIETEFIRRTIQLVGVLRKRCGVAVKRQAEQVDASLIGEVRDRHGDRNGGVAQESPVKLRIGEICSLQIGATKIRRYTSGRRAQIRLIEFRVEELRAAKVCSLQLRLRQIKAA